eukprot:560380-Amorphochlora_amoeboformis.AAC.1
MAVKWLPFSAAVGIAFVHLLVLEGHREHKLGWGRGLVYASPEGVVGDSFLEFGWDRLVKGWEGPCQVPYFLPSHHPIKIIHSRWRTLDTYCGSRIRIDAAIPTMG